MHLMVVQKRSSLLVGGNNILLSSEADLLAENTRNSNSQGSDEENGHDYESKDPLECNGFGKELANAKSCGEDAECESHSVVLEYGEEE